MVIMPDNWPLGTRQVSFSGICCLDGGRGERVMEQKDRHTEAQATQRQEKRERENEDCLKDRQK